MSAAKYVLVIDDDSDAREILIKILSTLGIATASAEDGKEAVALALLRTPTAIILDLMMPHMNGFEFLYWLRSQPKLRHVPVIVVSGYLGEFELPELSGLEFIEKGQMRARQVRQKMSAIVAGLLPEEVLADVQVPTFGPSSTGSAGARRNAVQQAIASLLSEREMSVLALIAEGYGNDEIASRLNVSTNTIKTHVKNIFSKLNVKNRTAAITHARQLGLIA